MNIWDIVIVIVIGAALFLAIRAVGKRKKTGGCGCGCADCSSRCANFRDGSSGTKTNSGDGP